jgi:hypothetical protein
MRRWIGAAAIGVVAVCASPAFTQEVEPPLTRVDDVVVEGRSLESVAQAFVEEVSAPARTRGLARWDGVVCIGVVNFQADAAHLIIDRMSDVARDLGVELGEPGCDPNLVVAGTTDGRAMADSMVRRHRQHFFRFGYTRSNPGSGALERFRSSDAPVRWWHVSLPIVVTTGEVAVRLPGRGSWSPPAECTSRRHGLDFRGCNLISDRLMRLIIIVDVDALPALTYAQLADYLTMIGLAQIDDQGEWNRFDTVLNVIQDPSGVSGLTVWDMAYLDGLYSGEDERISARDQADRLVTRLR